MAVPDESSPHAVPGPVGFLSLLRESLSLYRKAFGPTLKVFLPLYFGYWLVTSALLLPYLDQKRVSSSVSAALITLFLIGLPVVFVLSAALASRLMADRLVGVPTTSRFAELTDGSRLLLMLVPAVALMEIFFSFLGALSAGIGLLLGPPILVQAIVLERRDLRGAWARTKELLAGHALRVFVYLITASLATSLIRSGVLVPLAIWLDPKEDIVDLDDVYIGFFEMAVNTLTLPILVAAGLVLYLDLRSRKDDLTFEEFTAERAEPTSSSPD